MKIKTMLSLFCIPALSLIMISGCNLRDTKSTPESSNQSSGSVTVKNYEGKDVTISGAPQKIVILPIWEAEMVIDLIGTGRIAALSSFIDSEVTSYSAKEAAKVKNRVSSSEAEKIISLRPDLVLLDSFNDFDGSLTATLKGAGITVLTLTSPVTFEEIGDRLDTISKAVFAPEKGQQLISEMERRLDSVKEKVSGITQKVKVMYYEDYYSNDGTSAGMLCAYGKGSSFESIAAAAGAVNVCTAANYSAVSKETVINDWKPELLVVPGIKYDESFKAIDDKGATIISAIKKDKILSTLPAVKNDRVVALQDKYRGSTSHYMAFAVEELAKACYPDLFK